MNWFKETWRAIQRHIDEEINQHIAEMTTPTEHCEELSALVAELEGITERLRKLI